MTSRRSVATGVNGTGSSRSSERGGVPGQRNRLRIRGRHEWIRRKPVHRRRSPAQFPTSHAGTACGGCGGAGPVDVVLQIARRKQLAVAIGDAIEGNLQFRWRSGFIGPSMLVARTGSNAVGHSAMSPHCDAPESDCIESEST